MVAFAVFFVLKGHFFSEFPECIIQLLSRQGLAYYLLHILDTLQNLNLMFSDLDS